MYEAEVLGKRVVVQHLPLGGLVEWDSIGAPPTVSSVSWSRISAATPLPWVSGTGVNVESSDAPVTTVPWGSSGASISKGRGAEPSPHLDSSPKGS